MGDESVRGPVMNVCVHDDNNNNNNNHNTIITVFLYGKILSGKTILTAYTNTQTPANTSSIHILQPA